MGINMKVAVLLLVVLMSSVSSADTTARGKVLFTEGHSSPSCRTVKHRENDSAIERTFRIKNVDGDDDVQAILLMALAANKDVMIAWTEGVTTGCGSDPAIGWVRVLND